MPRTRARHQLTSSSGRRVSLFARTPLGWHCSRNGLGDFRRWSRLRGTLRSSRPARLFLGRGRLQFIAPILELIADHRLGCFGNRRSRGFRNGIQRGEKCLGHRLGSAGCTCRPGCRFCFCHPRHCSFSKSAYLCDAHDNRNRNDTPDLGQRIRLQVDAQERSCKCWMMFLLQGLLRRRALLPQITTGAVRSLQRQLGRCRMSVD